MSFFKHVGTVNGKKVIIVQRQIQNEEHMAVVIYSQIMPSKYHDDVMRLLESTEGQAAYEFRDILERRMMSDGQNMLQALSSENYLKRVPSNNVMVTPNSKSSVRLDELNNLLNAAGKGEEAVKKLERLENQQGYADPAKSARTDAVVAESVDISELSPSVANPAPDNNAMMAQMMQMMQAMQQSISDIEKRNKTIVASATQAAKKVVEEALSKKTKTSA